MATVVLTVAGSDSSGGAGLQADLKTLAGFGIHAATAVTAVTAQGATGVRAWSPVEPQLVRAQIRAALEELHPAAIKTGMLGTAAIVRAVVEELRAVTVPVVCDPVLLSSSGHRLLDEDAVAVLLEDLLPHVTVLTPNADEAAALTGRPVRTPDDAVAAGEALRALGATAVLVKGGHLLEARGVDFLVEADGVRRLEGEWIDTPHTHGTGCVTSAALAGALARGATIAEAAAIAKRTVTEALRRGEPYGEAAGAVAPPLA